MGQVVTLMPLLQQTIIVEQDAEFLNQVGGKATGSEQATGKGGEQVGGKATGRGTINQVNISPTQMPSSLPTKPKPSTSINTQQPSGNMGGGSSGNSIWQPQQTNTNINTQQPSGNIGGGSSGDSGQPQQPTDYGFNIPNWDNLSCSDVQSEVKRLTDIRMQKVMRPADANALLDSNIAYGNSILQNECQPAGTGGGTSGGGFGGGDFGLGDFGGFGESGFGTNGFGDSGDFKQPSAEDYEVLGYDKLGCPIYGYDENGTPLYGVDQNGNVITDPTVLPCGMKSMQQRGENPVKQIAKDITFQASVLVLGGIALVTILNNK